MTQKLQFLKMKRNFSLSFKSRNLDSSNIEQEWPTVNEIEIYLQAFCGLQTEFRVIANSGANLVFVEIPRRFLGTERTMKAPSNLKRPSLQQNFLLLQSAHFPTPLKVWLVKPNDLFPEALPYMGMCRCEGCGFCAV